jgi:hypothetical protein
MKNDQAGVRFKNEHLRARSHGMTITARILGIGLAILSLAIGVVLVFIPGPAFIFFIIAGALLASQWWALACLLDHVEIAFKRGWMRARSSAKLLISRIKFKRNKPVP